MKTDYSKVLWDIDMSRLGELSDSFVIQRVLAYGGVYLIFSIIREFGIDTVRHELNSMKEGGIQARRRRYLDEFVLS
jgi:hypothetical protein